MLILVQQPCLDRPFARLTHVSCILSFFKQLSDSGHLGNKIFLYFCLEYSKIVPLGTVMSQYKTIFNENTFQKLLFCSEYAYIWL